MTESKAREEKPLDYEEMARVVHLYLGEWCDESLPYPDMCADAVRKAQRGFEALQKQLEIAVKALNTIIEWDCLDEDLVAAKALAEINKLKGEG